MLLLHKSAFSHNFAATIQLLKRKIMKKLLISCLFILLMSANDAMASEVIPFTVNYDGHAWVIDGYQQLNRQRHFTITAVNKKLVKNISSETNIILKTLHCYIITGDGEVT